MPVDNKFGPRSVMKIIRDRAGISGDAMSRGESVACLPHDLHGAEKLASSGWQSALASFVGSPIIKMPSAWFEKDEPVLKPYKGD